MTKIRFDLIEYQREARDLNQPASLFQMWEEVCRLYDQGLIGKYELDEMKSVIWPNLKAVSALRQAVDSSFTKTQAA
jgi:FPC/CPF motif-containing protein YcgG